LTHFKENNISMEEKYDEFLADFQNIKDGNYSAYFNGLSDGVLNSGNITSKYRKNFR